MKSRQLFSLAWRESRFARKRLFLFLSAISLGVAALVAVQGFAANMRMEIRNQARAMLGADVALSARQPFGIEAEALLDSLAASGVEVVRATSFASMVLHEGTGGTRLVQVRAPDPGFPFYGTILTEPEGAWETFHEGRNMIVDPGLLLALDAEVGDSVSLGATRFRIGGTLERIPGDIEIASSFAPRVFIPSGALPETGLTGFGARIEYDAYLRIPEPELAAAFVGDHRDTWRSDRVRARTVEDQRQSMEEAIGRMSDFLGLTGVFALLLGGIGVASAMTAYMARKADAVAVLRCLGATARQIVGIYLIQAGVLGFAGALAGVVLGGAVQWALPRLFAGLLPVDVPIHLDGIAAVTGIIVGVWAAVVFALLPLLQIRAISPLSALRRRVEPIRIPARDPVRFTAWALLSASVILLIRVQTGTPGIAAIVAGAIGGTLVLLYASARLVIGSLRRSSGGALAFPLRQGVANLYRPGNQTTTVVLALGFGVFLIATILLTQSNILRPLMVDTTTRGNVLLFDVQEDQAPGVETIVQQEGGTVVHAAPIVPMRIAAINGVEAQRVPIGEGRDTRNETQAAASVAGSIDAENEMDGNAGERAGPSGWAIRREYNSTYRDTLQTSETLLAGRWWRADSADRADGSYDVSLDADLADELGVAVGDRIDWDVQGVRVPTTITSLRRVDWARLEPNFYAVFEPDALRGAPQMWIFLVRAEESTVRADIQRAVVAAHPNVAAIDLTLVQRALDDVIGRISLVIRFLAGFSVATGFIVLLGAVATGRLQRIRESVLLKTLGATRRQIGAILFTEFAVLGALAAVVGIGLATAAGWALARFLFRVGFAVDPLPILGLAAGITLISAILGMSASREVFRTTPMEAIREE